ncbi:MAG: hypothetical protein K940chlam9_00193 [Chlamydiae bacterium]|nr:hypothetical protein [Chlamydiota bacterium]
MTEYYFLASLLPPLEIGHVPALGFPELRVLLEQNLSQGDKEKVVQFLRILDLQNLRAYWAGEPLDPRANVTTPEEMEQALLDVQWPVGEEFPDYLRDYFEKYHTNEDRLAHFPLLMGQFFAYHIEHDKRFVQDYYRFQREMRLVETGFRAKKLGKDLSYELQYEDPKDPIVAQILAQRDARTYEPPFEYKELKPIFEEFGDSPQDLHKALYEYQFAQIIELWGGELFALDRILNYMARLILVERWLELDVQKGIQVIDKIEKDVA